MSLEWIPDDLDDGGAWANTVGLETLLEEELVDAGFWLVDFCPSAIKSPGAWSFFFGGLDLSIFVSLAQTLTCKFNFNNLLLENGTGWTKDFISIANLL